jgi:tetraacyldisaccharide 4'-kinase
LVEQLRASGYRPGVVSRGYGGRNSVACEVDPDSDPASLGDEPVLLARRTMCPVWVGRSRVEAATNLLASHPEVNVIVADDGLQHYALARDVEIVVVDGQRRFGNELYLPAGPLREGLGRLAQVDAVVINGHGAIAETACPVCNMTLVGQSFFGLHDHERTVSADYFRGRQVHALAGIGNPDRFFVTLAGMGLNVVRHPFPDHHPFRQEDLPGGTLIMTEKDAVKCAAYAHPDAWVLAVDARVSGDLEHLILNKLESRHGQQAA